MQDTTKQISKNDNLIIPRRKETNRIMTCSPAVDYKHQINLLYFSKWSQNKKVIW